MYTTVRRHDDDNARTSHPTLLLRSRLRCWNREGYRPLLVLCGAPHVGTILALSTPCGSSSRAGHPLWELFSQIMVTIWESYCHNCGLHWMQLILIVHVFSSIGNTAVCFLSLHAELSNAHPIRRLRSFLSLMDVITTHPRNSYHYIRIATPCLACSWCTHTGDCQFIRYLIPTQRYRKVCVGEGLFKIRPFDFSPLNMPRCLILKRPHQPYGWGTFQDLQDCDKWNSDSECIAMGEGFCKGIHRLPFSRCAKCTFSIVHHPNTKIPTLSILALEKHLIQLLFCCTHVLFCSLVYVLHALTPLRRWCQRLNDTCNALPHN